MSKLIVALINWNTLELTENCLESLIPEIESLDHEIWIVDNASSDGSKEMIKERFPGVVLIENEDNVGFARANNQILAEAKGDYYLLLNTDTIVPSGSIRGLLEFMEKNPKAAAAGPKLRNAEGVVERPLKPLPTLAGELRYCLVNHFYPLGSLCRSLFSSDKFRFPSKPARAEVLSAACLIIRKDVLDNVGRLSEEYFLFSEENDFFLRMAQKGYYGYFVPEIEMIHLIGASRKKRGSIDSEVNFLKSRKLFFRKFQGNDIYMFYAIYLPFLVWSLVLASAKRILGRKSDYPRMYRELLKALIGGR